MTPTLPADPIARARLLARFWARVRVAHVNACWPYRGARNRHGHGRMRVGNTELLVGRLVWILVHGASPPPGATVRQTCRRRHCANPGHLTTGKVPPAPPRRTQPPWPSGAKLRSREEVRALRLAHAKGATVPELAARFGISTSHVSAVVRRRTWRNVA